MRDFSLFKSTLILIWLVITSLFLGNLKASEPPEDEKIMVTLLTDHEVLLDPNKPGLKLSLKGGTRLTVQSIKGDTIYFLIGKQEYRVPKYKTNWDSVIQQPPPKKSNKKRTQKNNKFIEELIIDPFVLMEEKKEIPIHGKKDRHFRKIDRIITQFMKRERIFAASFSISHHPGYKATRLYGWNTPELTEPLTDIHTKFRLGNLSQKVVKSAIFELIDQKKINHEDNVLNLIEPKLLESDRVHSSWKRLKVINQLKGRIELQGHPLRVLKEFHDDVIDSPNKTIQDLRGQDALNYLVNEPARYEDNTHYYSPATGILSARIIEKVEDKAFLEALNQILKTSFYLGKTFNFPKEEEVIITNPNIPAKRQIIYNQHYSSHLVDGGYGLASSSADFCEYLETYWLGNEKKLKPKDSKWSYYKASSSEHGASVIALHVQDHTQATLLFNTTPDKKYNALKALADDLFKEVQSTARKLQ